MIEPIFLRRKTLVFSLATIGLWISLFFSYHSLPGGGVIIPNVPYTIGSTGGWPFTAFRYPLPPMGGDYVPNESFFSFFFNFVFWAVLAGLALMLVPKKIVDRMNDGGAAILAGFITFVGILYLLIRFD